MICGPRFETPRHFHSNVHGVSSKYHPGSRRQEGRRRARVAHRGPARATRRHRRGASKIPYNYTSFSDREIVMRLLGNDAWDILLELRQGAKPPQRAPHVVQGAGRYLGGRTESPICRRICSPITAGMALTEAMRHRLREIEKRRVGDDSDTTRSAKVAELLKRAHAAVDAFEKEFSDSYDFRRRSNANSRVTHKGTSPSMGWRASLTSPMPPTGAWNIPTWWCTRHGRKSAPIVRTLIDLELTIIPRGGGTGYTGGAIPLTKRSAVINTEKLDTLGKVEKGALPGLAEQVNTIRCEAGVVTRRAMEAAGAAGLVWRATRPRRIPPASAATSP